MHIVGHGIDLVEISRIERMLQDHGDRFVERCFTEVEQGYAERSPGLRAERYAARFACKEAVLKALGTGWSKGVSWHEIEVRRRPSGLPLLTLSGRCAELSEELGVTEWHISMSHTGDLAMASAIAFGGSGPAWAE